MTEPWFPNPLISALAFIKIILLCENIHNNMVFVIPTICVLLSFLQMPFWMFSTLLETPTLSLPPSGLRFSPGSQLKVRLSCKAAAHICRAQGKSKLEAFGYSLRLPFLSTWPFATPWGASNKPRDTPSCVAKLYPHPPNRCLLATAQTREYKHHFHNAPSERQNWGIKLCRSRKWADVFGKKIPKSQVTWSTVSKGNLKFWVDISH